MVAVSGAVGSFEGLKTALGAVKGFGELSQRNKEFDANTAFKEREATAKQNQTKIKKFTDDFKTVATSLKEYKDGIYQQSGGTLSPETKAGLDESITETIKTYMEGAQLMGLPNTSIQSIGLIGKALLAEPSPQQAGITAGNVAGVTSIAEADTVAESFDIDRSKVAQTQGLLPDDLPIEKLIEVRDELLERGETADAKSVQDVISSKGASPTVDPRTLSRETSTDKVKREMVDLEVNAKNIMDVGTQIIGLMDVGGEGSVEVAGQIAQGITGLVSGLTGIAQNFGVDISKFESGASADDRIQKAESILGKSSGTSAQIRSALVDLAYAAAAAQGQTGKAVSDKDYENNLKQLGAGSGGLKNFRSTMISFLERNNEKLKNKHTGLNSLLGVDARRPALSFDVDFSKKKKTPESLEDLGDGTFKMPDGTIIRRKK